MKLTREDLWSLEEYAQKRETFRQDVIAHKKSRNVALGPNATLYFEDELTMRYQIQEMLRVERIFETAEIEEELASYNPLIPDGSNWKATFMIEYGNVEERKNALTKLIGVERSVWFNVEGNEKVYAICNEDMDRETEDKTSAVHFMRFELSPSMVASAKVGLPITFGIDHPFYKTEMVIPPNIQQALIIDLK